MKNKSVYLIVGVILIVVIILGVYYNNQPKEKIKIGVIATLTGVGSYNGQQEIRGLELAKEEINSAGGINGRMIELIIEDSQADNAKAVSAFNKLVEIDQVKFIVGDSWSSTTVAIVPIANEKKVILISPVAILNELSKDDMFFRTVPTTHEMMIVLAEYVYGHDINEIGILRQNTPFGAEHSVYFREEFEKLGGKIVGEESFGLTQSDLRTEITKINAKNPDAIFNLHATGPMIGLLIKQAIDLGVNVNWIGSFGSENANLVKQYPQETDGLIYPYIYDYYSSEKNVVDFVNAYKIKYDEQPDFTAANSYDALRILTNAITEEGENPEKVKEYLLKIRNYPGGSGTISFDSNGDVKKEIFMKQIKNTSFIKI